MSKTIHSMDAALTSTGGLGKDAGRRLERGGSGAFSRLLESGRTDKANRVDVQRASGHADRDDARQVAESGDRDDMQRMQESGKNQPHDAQQDAADSDGCCDPEAAPRDVASRVPERADGAPGLQTQAGDGHEAGSAGDATGTAVPVTATLYFEQTVADPAAEASARAAAPANGAGKQDTDGASAGGADKSVAQAVRQGLMQMLAARTAQDNSADTLAGNDRDQTATPDQPLSAARAAAGVMSFTDALQGTGASTPSARVQVPVGQPGWGRAVGEQVVWFVSQHIRSASLRLNPQHLGPLELQLHMDGDRASIAFATQHAPVRDALEASLPRLRDMFAEQGLNLVNVNVSQQDVNGRREHDTEGYRSAASGRAEASDQPLPLTGVMTGAVTAHGLVDYYI